jgi:3-oxoacyl-[acyl-carrier-protein] synthase-3
MIFDREIVIERIGVSVGERQLHNSEIVSEQVVAATGFPVRRITEKTLFELAVPAVHFASRDCRDEIVAVIAATFSNEVRFPSLAVRVVSELGLPSTTAAFDLQMACSAYPYALLTAGRLAATAGGKVLVVDGDVQSHFAKEPATAVVAGDACSATLVSVKEGGSRFAFYSGYGEQLKCAETLEMDGFGVFSFVATTVRGMLSDLLAKENGACGRFVPHQANMYMVRQLAKSIGLSDKLLTSGEKYGNVGSASVPLTIASASQTHALSGERILIAGFGAGLSAAAGFVSLAPHLKCEIFE